MNTLYVWTRCCVFMCINLFYDTLGTLQLHMDIIFTFQKDYDAKIKKMAESLRKEMVEMVQRGTCMLHVS